MKCKDGRKIHKYKNIGNYALLTVNDKKAQLTQG